MEFKGYEKEFKKVHEILFDRKTPGGELKNLRTKITKHYKKPFWSFSKDENWVQNNLETLIKLCFFRGRGDKSFYLLFNSKKFFENILLHPEYIKLTWDGLLKYTPWVHPIIPYQSLQNVYNICIKNISNKNIKEKYKLNLIDMLVCNFSSSPFSNFWGALTKENIYYIFQTHLDTILKSISNLNGVTIYQEIERNPYLINNDNIVYFIRHQHNKFNKWYLFTKKFFDDPSFIYKHGDFMCYQKKILFEKWFDKYNFDYDNFSYCLVAYHNDKFEKWFDKKKFNYLQRKNYSKDYLHIWYKLLSDFSSLYTPTTYYLPTLKYFLAIVNSKYFDLWWCPKRYYPTHETYTLLEQYCKEHESKWKTPTYIINKLKQEGD